MISSPTQRMDSMTIIAINTTKRLSYRRTGTPLLCASDGLMLTKCSRLKQNSQKITVSTKAISRPASSVRVMLKISPMSRELYLEKLPPTDSTASPMARPQEAKTLMTVSAPALPRYLIQFKSRANRIPKMIMDKVVSVMPRITPRAMPVMAECPSASEKNAILLLTIMVPSRPKSGVMSRMAISAFFINSY